MDAAHLGQEGRTPGTVIDELPQIVLDEKCLALRGLGRECKKSRQQAILK
jgi:hypothetical protein